MADTNDDIEAIRERHNGLFELAVSRSMRYISDDADRIAGTDPLDAVTAGVEIGIAMTLQVMFEQAAAIDESER